MRSPTAADIAAQVDDIFADFAGLSADVDEKLSAEQIAWADEIFVMEARHKKRLNVLFGRMLWDKKVRVLAIPDKYSYNDPELIHLLQSKLRVIFER